MYWIRATKKAPNMNTREDIVKQIEYFGSLPDGWHYGTGAAATPEACRYAKIVDGLFRRYGSDEVEVFPDIDGGILASGYYGSNTINILCGPDGSIDLEHDDEAIRKTVEEQPNIQLHHLQRYLKKIARSVSQPCWFVYYIQNTTVPNSGDLRVPHFSHHPIHEQFQYSTGTAQRLKVTTNVSTLGSTTQESRATPSFSGDSRLISYLMDSTSRASRHQPATHAIETSEDYRRISVKV